MTDAPKVKPGDWINVGSIECVVIELRSTISAVADMDVICNPAKPAVYGVTWEGDRWTFVHPMRGDYAEHHPAAAPFVNTLVQGRSG